MPGDESVLGAAVNTLVDNATMVKNVSEIYHLSSQTGGMKVEDMYPKIHSSMVYCRKPLRAVVAVATPLDTSTRI